MNGSGRWGHVLNVELAYRRSNHSRILALFSGMGGNGSDVGLSGIDDICGQSQDIVSSCGAGAVVQR